MRLLLVEDDPQLSARLIRQLSDAGFIVEQVGDGQRALGAPETNSYSLAILDIGLPHLDGLSVLRQWRKQGLKLPVIILTARDGWKERVEGLRAGADDYLGKPFEPEELLARIEAITRRHLGHAQDKLTSCGLELHPDSGEVTTELGERYALTGNEYRLLHALLLRPGQVISREKLASEAFEDADQSGNQLEVYIARLRRKLGKNRIATRRGLGYVLNKTP